jgi:hypothetical protein
LVMVVSGAAAHAATSSADEQAVTAAEHQWLKSQQTNNVELLAPLLDDKVVETRRSGSSTRPMVRRSPGCPARSMLRPPGRLSTSWSGLG